MLSSADHALFLPMAVLALWTLHVLLLVPIARFKAGRAGQVNFEDFRLGESARVPEAVRLPNRNFMNLLEVPVLFYVAGFTAHTLGLHNPWLVGLFWLYVGLRVAHSVVHLKADHSVPVRLVLFALSNGVIVAIWWWLLVHLLTT
jgi:hypothetical protein